MVSHLKAQIRHNTQDALEVVRIDVKPQRLVDVTLHDVVEVVLILEHAAGPADDPVAVRDESWTTVYYVSALTCAAGRILSDAPALSAGESSRISRTCQTFSSAFSGVQKRRLRPSKLAPPSLISLSCRLWPLTGAGTDGTAVDQVLDGMSVMDRVTCRFDE